MNNNRLLHLTQERRITLLRRIYTLNAALQVADGNLADILPELKQEYKMKFGQLQTAIEASSTMRRNLSQHLEENMYDCNANTMQIFDLVLGMRLEDQQKVLSFIQGLMVENGHAVDISI